MRASRSLARHGWRLGFTLAYTLTVLPFTVQFFAGFVSPPAGPWTLLYRCALPLFLASLEYAGIALAVLHWRERGRAEGRAGEALALFAACQALAVASTFYDVRAAEWAGAVKARSDAVAALKDARKKRFDEARTLRHDLGSRLDRIQADAAAAQKRMADLALAPGEKVRPGDDSAWLLESERGQRIQAALRPLQDTVAEDVRQEADIRRRLADLDAPPAGPAAGVLPGTDAPTALAYVGETALAGGSLAALALALLFPATVLAMGRVIASGEAPPGPSASVDLRRELEEGAALPADRHDAFAAIMEPTLAAHVASVRAARRAAARGLGLHLDLAAELDVLESAASLKEQIEGSGLSPSARERLASCVDRLLSEGIAPPPAPEPA